MNQMNALPREAEDIVYKLIEGMPQSSKLPEYTLNPKVQMGHFKDAPKDELI